MLRECEGYGVKRELGGRGQQEGPRTVGQSRIRISSSG
jgi:hypothetical protein